MGRESLTPVIVPDEAYDASSWNSSREVPTKNAIRDVIVNLVLARVITVTSGSMTAGATANTDYIYLISGAHTITLPTAVGNKNRYTIKNNHSSAITVDTTSSQQIENTLSIQISPEDSIDVISDGSAWFII